MRWMRRVVFWLFVVAYLILCPLTVLYALGYLWRPGAQEGLVKTGLIHLSTAPPGASVYLGKKRYTKRTPATLRNLLPGDYRLTVTLRRYRPWTMTVPVEAERATVLERILLLPERLSPEVLLPDAFQDLIPLPGTHLLLLVGGPRIEQLVVYDWHEDRGRLLVPAGSLLEGGRILSIMSVRGSPVVLFHVDTKAGERWLWVACRGEDTVREDITSLFPKAPQEVRWDPDEPTRLFALSRGVLSRLETARMAIFPHIAEQVRGYGVLGQQLYLLYDDALELADDAGKTEEVLLAGSPVARVLEGSRGLVQVTALSKRLVALLGERGQLTISRPPYQLVDNGVLGFEWHAARQRLVIWLRDRLGLVDEAPEAPGDVQWVWTQGDHIAQAFWLYEGSHVLFRDGDQVSLLELEPTGTPRVHLLVRVKGRSAIAYSEDSGTLYYLDRATGRLSALELLPKRSLLLLPFAERDDAF